MRSIGFSSVLSSLIVGTGLVSFGLTACGEDPGPSYPNGTGNPSTTMDPTGATVSPTSSGPSLSPTVSPGNSSVSPTSTTPGNTSPGISPVTPQPSNTSPINPAPPASSPSNPQPTLPTTDDTDTSDTTMDTAAPQMPNTADSTVPNTADDSNVDPTDDSMGMQTDDTTVDATMATSDDTDGMDTTSDMMTEPDPGGPAPAEPSEGCGKQGSQTGSSGSPLNVSNHQYYVKLPNNYDANTPYRLLFMFNPTGNPINWAEQNAGFEAIAANDLIRVYPHPANSSNGWNGSDVPFFQPLYDKVTQDYCVDKARVFAAGESSGGDFAGILGCEHADKIRAIGPCATKRVNGYELNANSRNCTGQVSAVIIHGVDDKVLNDADETGMQMRDFYSQINGCTAMSTPVDGFTDNLSNCIEYQGCDEGYPVIWCHHADPEYYQTNGQGQQVGTNHGWPKFAARMLWQHFQAF